MTIQLKRVRHLCVVALEIGDELSRERNPSPWATAVVFLQVLILGTTLCFGQVSVQERSKSPDAYRAPKGYLCFRSTDSGMTIQVDGKLDEPAWQSAPWTDDFIDIEGDGKPAPRFRTRAKMLWDDQYFYISAELEEPHLQGTFTKHDSYIFHQDNDFEVFIDPDGDGHNYGEYEMNALNTGWDLRLSKPYKNGGQADDGWEIPGLKSAVHLNGTVNKPDDIDHGWTIELAFPWSVLGKLIDNANPTNQARQNTADNVRKFAPRNGDQWRVNFSRVEWRYDVEQGKYRKVADRREDNWVWSPQWTINMHRPETWGYVQFSAATAGSVAAKQIDFVHDPAGAAKQLLHRIQYAQVDFREQHQRWGKSLAELGLEAITHSSLQAPPAMEIVGEHFEARVEVKLSETGTATWCIREDAKIWRKP